MKRIIATRLLLVEGASPPDLATARLVSQASGSGSILWLTKQAAVGIVRGSVKMKARK